MYPNGRGGGRGGGRGKARGHFSTNGYSDHQTSSNGVGTSNNPTDEPPPISNFFNFTSMPLPNIASAPQRTSSVDPVARIFDSTTPFMRESDDNKEYVKYWLKIEDEQIKKVCKSRMDGVQNEDRSYCGDRSVIGTIPAKANDDAEVFWKFDMNRRDVDSSHLMINKSKEKLLSLLHSRQVVIVEGFTGCGKTTQVPQFILDDAAENKTRCRIVVTQPRRIAAISVANRVCQERGWQIGSLVGYQVGMDRKVSETTRLTYMTTGVLLEMLIGRQTLNEFTHIVIDEVHERDLETDLLLLVIKKLMLDKGDFETKILLMSATLNSDKFRKYFPSWGIAELNSTAMIKVTQPSQYKITEYYLDTLAAEYGFDGFGMDGSEEPRAFQENYDIACKIIDGLDFFEYSDDKFSGQATVEEREIFWASEHSKNRTNRGAVLVFLPGLMEIDTLFKQLTEISTTKAGSCNKTDVVKWTILPLHSSITNEEQQKVFLSARPGYRKIILATNIAESSITVPDIRYVIDFCLTKSLSCDPSTNYTCLRLEWASKNQCIQRRGRCGRVASGHVFRMVSRKFYEMMPQEALPEMEKSSLESVVLHVKLLGMGSPLEILALAVDPPKQSGIGRAVANLKEVGALTLKVRGRYERYDGDLTHMGRVMSKLPIDIRYGRLIMLGLVFGVVNDAIIIAVGLSTKSPFSSPFTKRLEAYLSKLSWSVRAYSDCFAILNAFTTWSEKHRAHEFRTYKEEKDWCRTYFLQISVLRDMGALVDEIKNRLKRAGIDTDHEKLSHIERSLILKLVIAGAFYPNYFVRSRPNRKEYEREIVKDVGGFNPLNSIVYQGFPIEQPGKLYAKHIVAPLTHHQSVPQVQFLASKVIMIFDPRGDKIGPISHGVYRALKMRQLRQKVQFYILGREDAVKELAKANDSLEQRPLLATPPCTSIPSIKVNEFQCYLTHVSGQVEQVEKDSPTAYKNQDTPTEFWVIRTDDSFILMEINEILEQESEVILPLPLNALEVGNMCIVINHNQRFRARIECIKSADDVMVYLIDNGLSIWRPAKQLYGVTSNMYRLGLHKKPALAMQCRLSELKAAVRNGSVWYSEAIKDFQDFTLEANNSFIMKVYSVVDSVIAGELFSPILNKTANERLLSQKFADKMIESRPSVDNNNARRLWEVLNYEESTMRAYNERQMSGWQADRVIEPPELNDDTGSLVTLRGPNSPLEMSFSSLCRSAHLKQVNVEPGSVNCVALDQEPFNPCSRVLIAANVGIAHRSGNILARETTMMPAIPGLLSLLALVFCPKLEFRTDDQKIRYTGCVSGLGIDPVDEMPIYPDHDMEIIFDVHIDNQDLHNVNSIRMTMNMLMRERLSEHRSANNLREKVRNEIISLLQREREHIDDEYWPPSTHVWNIIKEEDKVYPGNETERCETDVFPLHFGVRLNPMGDHLEPVPPKNMFQPPPY